MGQIARHSPGLVRAIHEAGHEVACHSWNHRRILGMTPESFRENARLGKDALEQATGAAVVGFRAPTFSIVRETAWASMCWLSWGSCTTRRSSRCITIATASPTPHVGRSCGGPRTRSWNCPGDAASSRPNLPIGGGGYFRLLPCGC